jgi:putative endonuclease
MYYVYILLLKNHNLYKGSTDDLRRRFKEHNSGNVESTKNYLPAKLIYYEAYLLKSDAETREKYLKTGDGRREIKKQLKNYLEVFDKK